jgi:hypothetical protein
MTASLWITYAWADNKEGDFDYLVSALEAAGIHAVIERPKPATSERLKTSHL